ncbi:MAG: hypothetical protein R3F21_09055 [Myxococcota bacterium]
MCRQQTDDQTEALARMGPRKPETAQGRIGEIIAQHVDGVTCMDQVRNRFAEIRLALLAMTERRTTFLGMPSPPRRRSACSGP